MKIDPAMRTFRTPKVGVLLAAGLGKRLRPLTHQTPKPLLHAENRPLIEYAIDALTYSNIKTIYVVTNYLESQIVEYLERYKNIIDIVFCHQEAPDGTAGAVHCVKKHLESIEKITNYLVISATDYVFPERYIKALIDFHAEGSSDISVSLRDIDKKMANASSRVVLDTHGNIERIDEKPAIVGDDEVVAATLLYIVPVKIFSFVSSINVSIRGEYELADVINKMIKNGYSASGLKQPSTIDPILPPVHDASK